MEEKKFFVAGVQHHEMHKVINELEIGDEFELEPESTNKFDPNAIRIVYGDTMCGYVPRKFSAEISAAMERGAELECIIVTLNKDASPWEWCEVAIRPIFEEDEDDIEPICPDCGESLEVCECEDKEDDDE